MQDGHVSCISALICACKVEREREKYSAPLTIQRSNETTFWPTHRCSLRLSAIGLRRGTTLNPRFFTFLLFRPLKPSQNHVVFHLRWSSSPLGFHFSTFRLQCVEHHDVNERTSFFAAGRRHLPLLLGNRGHLHRDRRDLRHPWRDQDRDGWPLGGWRWAEGQSEGRPFQGSSTLGRPMANGCLEIFQSRVLDVPSRKAPLEAVLGCSFPRSSQ